MGQQDTSGLNGPKDRTPSTWKTAAVAITLGTIISTILLIATSTLGIRLSQTAFIIGFATTSYYLYHMPGPRAATATGLYGTAILIAISPILYALPDITTISGYPTGEFGDHGSIFIVTLLGPIFSFIAAIVFGLGYVIDRSHQRRIDTKTSQTKSAKNRNSLSLRTVNIALAMGLLNGILIRISTDRNYLRSWYGTNPYSDLYRSAGGPSILNSPDLIPWLAFLVVFTGTAVYVSQKRTPRKAISSGLYSTVALLILPPIISLVIPNPVDVLQEFPDSVLGFLIFYIGNISIAAVLFCIGYQIKRPPHGDESGTNNSNSSY